MVISTTVEFIKTHNCTRIDELSVKMIKKRKMLISNFIRCYLLARTIIAYTETIDDHGSRLITEAAVTLHNKLEYQNRAWPISET